MSELDKEAARLVRDWLQSEFKALISYARGEIKSYDQHSKNADKMFERVLDSIPEEK